jgi:hypothetical protein
MTAVIRAPLEIRVRPDLVSFAWRLVPEGVALHFAPCPAGGVNVTATDGRASASFYDPDGFASRAATIRFQRSLIREIERGRKKLRRELLVKSKAEAPWLNSAELTPLPEGLSCRVIHLAAEIRSDLQNCLRDAA